MRRILISSLCVNLVLLGLVWRNPSPAAMPVRQMRSEAGPASAPPRPGLARHVAQVRAVTPWSRIENRDTRSFMANLRATGCPEATIRDIVTLRVCHACRKRMLDLRTELALKQVENPNLDDAEARKFIDRQRVLRDEMISEVESVLGVDWAVLSSSLIGNAIAEDRLN